MGYAILLNFLVYVTLPVPLYFAGLLLGIGTFVLYVITAVGLARREVYFWHQVGSIYFIFFHQNINFHAHKCDGFNKMMNVHKLCMDSVELTIISTSDVCNIRKYSADSCYLYQVIAIKSFKCGVYSNFLGKRSHAELGKCESFWPYHGLL